ncbi:MAG: hydroxymethylglutaryl-CoA lyase [Chloroflexi bacterium]|nr:hydroxymethylglutaryl-CoA lyase [Chloroflexota bacterium]
MILPKSALITDVSPRDGLQSEGASIPTDDKVRLINALAHTGIRRIEVTSFVHPKIVPSMADADEVFRRIERVAGVSYQALVPNVRGADRAIAAGADELNVVLSTTEGFNLRNLNMTVAESIETFRAVAEVARAAGLRAEVGLSVVFGCPYDGPVGLREVLDVTDRLIEAGAEEILFADTIGVANPRQVTETVESIRARWPKLNIGLHFHDTRGLGIANVLSGLEAGVNRFDASVAGIGACPFAPGATGNVCTEDTVHMLESMGVNTGIDLEALIDCARVARELVRHEVPSRLLRAGAWRVP